MVTSAYMLDKYRARHRDVKIGDSYTDVTSVFSGTKSEKINEGLEKGHRVFALPLHDGRRMFEKFRLKPDGTLLHRKDGGLVWRDGPRQIVACLVCNPENPFIASDEIFIPREHSLQGVARKMAEGVFVQLNLDPKKDAYAMFICAPDAISNSAKIFRDRLTGILREGGNWDTYFQVKGLMGSRREIEESHGVQDISDYGMSERGFIIRTGAVRGFDSRETASLVSRVFADFSKQLEGKAHRRIKDDIASKETIISIGHSYEIKLLHLLFECDVYQDLRTTEDMLETGRNLIKKIGVGIGFDTTDMEKRLSPSSFIPGRIIITLDQNLMYHFSESALLRMRQRSHKNTDETLQDLLQIFNERTKQTFEKINESKMHSLYEATRIHNFQQVFVDSLDAVGEGSDDYLILRDYKDSIEAYLETLGGITEKQTLNNPKERLIECLNELSVVVVEKLKEISKKSKPRGIGKQKK